ncbi:MAG: hypothetical protein E7616_10110 [Ruminococcaceae bacterium]|nr:hypothetical protein [Oscillospiraceae bacterium]
MIFGMNSYTIVKLLGILLLLMPFTMLIVLVSADFLFPKIAPKRWILAIVLFLICAVFVFGYLSDITALLPLIPLMLSLYITPFCAAVLGATLFLKKEKLRVAMGILLSLSLMLNIIFIKEYTDYFKGFMLFLALCAWNALFYFGSAGIACGVRKLIRKRR